MSSTKEIAALYAFSSESSPGKTYQTLLYTDGSTSCECPGWKFKRKLAGGGRTCKHVRDIDCGLAERHAVSFVIYSQAAPRSTRPPLSTKTETGTQGGLSPRPGSRRFNVDG